MLDDSYLLFNDCVRSAVKRSFADIILLIQTNDLSDLESAIKAHFETIGSRRISILVRIGARKVIVDSDVTGEIEGYMRFYSFSPAEYISYVEEQRNLFAEFIIANPDNAKALLVAKTVFEEYAEKSRRLGGH